MSKKRRPSSDPRPKGQTARSRGPFKRTGPVTLREAQRLARTITPAAQRKAAVIAPTPALLGAERKTLALHDEQERERRIREYTATMAIMKRRGEKGLRGRARRGAPRPKAAGRPLQVFAEGDSWFDYPKPLFGGGIIPRLEKRLGVPILNLAKAGDEVRHMLGVEERERLIEQLGDGCPAGGPWDALLFSGGGNDVVGNPMALWIRDYNASTPPAGLVNQPRFDAALALVRAGYEDLIELRDTLSPETRLIFHCYDFAIPDGRGVCFFGPWLKPTFDLRKFPTRAAAFEVMKVLLGQFALMLQSLQNAHANVTFINGQGTLAPQTSSWDNELHPEKDGFNAFAKVFHQRLKQLFPTRVL
jgi:hypothetical protein